MTATEPPGWWKPKATAHHTLLPPEIWLVIFDHATTVPQALDTHLRDPFDLPSNFPRGFFTEKSLLVVGIDIVLECVTRSPALFIETITETTASSRSG
ncbi:hypothetical protein JAAARDRAFT_34610 [Jaapia argillacea MUCL 33604]|uniref:Uncharacterized protein n=1 Tax=Jaapia argillacea MUCL 33604 TaxID=933084 RepID=A0A067PVA1_9AGAM|nr:hypothetical protein JAAARDRAFT_34610 [Jaapia argillacea MUCL 33604]